MKVQRGILCLFTVVQFCCYGVYGQELEWAISLNSTDEYRGGSSLITDGNGNTYYSLYSPAYNFCQIIKVAPDGTVLIDKRLQGVRLIKIDVDEEGFIYMIGNYELVKLTPALDTIWKNSLPDEPQAFDVSKNSINVLFQGGLSDNPFMFDATHSVDGKKATILCSYDQNGNVLWARGYDFGCWTTAEKRMSSDNTGELFIILPCPIADVTAPADAMIVKISPTGDVRWMNGSPNEAQGLTVSEIGDVYITCNVSECIEFNDTLYNEKNGRLSFIIKYESNKGIPDVLRTYQLSNGSYLNNLLSYKGRLYLSGYSSDTLDLGNGVHNFGSSHFFIVSYGEGGDFKEMKAAKGSGGFLCEDAVNNVIYYAGLSGSFSMDGHTINEPEYRHIILKFNSIPLDIKKTFKEQSLKIYPNPFTNEFIVEGDLEDCAGFISDVNGRKIKSLNLTMGPNRIPLFNSPGIYFLSIVDHEGREIYNKPVIKSDVLLKNY